MKNCIFLAGIVGIFLAQTGLCQQPNQGKKIPPALEKLAKLTPAEILLSLDKDKNGFLSKKELPPFLANNFSKLDRNMDGKLNPTEISLLAQVLRQRLAQTKGNIPPNQNIAALMKQIMTMDVNQDDKISRKESRGKIAQIFDQIDRNQDGFLDRLEVRGMLQRQLAGSGQQAMVDQTDFDALDADADGRLTRQELQTSRWISSFETIDQDRNGQLNRREFNGYLDGLEKKNQSK